MEIFTDDLIEINNDNSFNNNNFNIGNISSIHKKIGKSREESPTSQRDDKFNLTSFITTIGGKASNNLSNTKSFGNKMNNSKQVRTFKIRTKDGLVKGANDNNRNHNSKYNSNNNSRNNSNSYRNNLLRKDSPNSINSNNSSNNNSNSNDVNKDNNTNNFPENTSLKEQNINKNDNNLPNKIVIRKKNNSCFSDIISNNIFYN